MDGFREGYEFYKKTAGGYIASHEGYKYVENVNHEIDELTNNLNSFQGYKTDVSILKGDIAEYYHSGTFNINAALHGSKSRTYVVRSHDYASADITNNFDDTKYGVKYYKSGIESAKAQSVSVLQKYKEYSAKGGTDTLEEYLLKHGYPDESVLNNPIYAGQVRIIPKDQLQEAINYLTRKINDEITKRPEQVARYQEALNLLQDKIRNNEGIESIPLSVEEAKKIAQFSKQGIFNAADFGLTPKNLIDFKCIAQQAFKAGITAAVISLVLRVAPEILKALSYLIKQGEIDENQFKRIGFSAIQGASEGFVRGSIAAAITTACTSENLGKACKSIDPHIIGISTVIVINTMKNSFKVAIGKMTKKELVNELVREMFVSSCSIIVGNIMSGIPVLGFMIGSFLGSVIGSFAYSKGQKAILSFCVDSGFTMFGLVEQDYQLPEEVMREIGIDIFEYDKFEYDKFEYGKFQYNKFEHDKFEYDKFDVVFLRRGVIGVSKIGYVF